MVSSRLATIRLQMTVYGSAFGFVGGGLLGAGFVALTYNPLFEMNILLVLVGMTATMLTGLVFGFVSGGISGMMVSLLASSDVIRSRFRLLYKLVASALSVSVTVFLFVHLAYAVGRPYVFDTAMYPSWLWALSVAIVSALIVSILTVNQDLSQPVIKRKPAPAYARIDNR